MPQKRQHPSDPTPPLVPEENFKRVLKTVLATSKEESDRQLAEFQASNKARREEKKRKPKT